MTQKTQAEPAAVAIAGLVVAGLAAYLLTLGLVVLTLALFVAATVATRLAGLPPAMALAATAVGAVWLMLASPDAALGQLAEVRTEQVRALRDHQFLAELGSSLPRWLWSAAPFALVVGGLATAALPALPGLFAGRSGRPVGSRTPRVLRGFAVRGLARRIAAARRLPSDGVLLGVDERARATRLSDTELAAHSLVLGASGAGKTTTLVAVLSDLIRRGRPVAYIDLKGDPCVAHELGDAARAAGRPFAHWSVHGPDHWNPLAEGDPTALKDKLIGLEAWTEPHYKRAAERYLQNVFTVLHNTGAPAATLSEVVALMEPARLNARLRETPEPLADRVADYLDGLGPDQLSAIRGLATRLAVISESGAGPYLEPNGDRTIELRKLLAEGGVAVFSLDSSSYGELAAQLGGLVIQDLKAVCGQRLQGDGDAPHAYVAIDEFSALDHDHVRSLLVRGRASGISLLIATQSLADLDRAGDGFRDVALDNTQVKLIHRQDVPEAAETLAGIAGTETTWDHTRQTRDDLIVGRDTGLGTRRRVER